MRDLLFQCLKYIATPPRLWLVLSIVLVSTWWLLLRPSPPSSFSLGSDFTAKQVHLQTDKVQDDADAIPFHRNKAQQDLNGFDKAPRRDSIEKVHPKLTTTFKPKEIKMEPTQQADLDYMGKHVTVKYGVVTNGIDKGIDTPYFTYKVGITLTNTGDKAITWGNWQLYFYHVRMIEQEKIMKEKQVVLEDAKLRLFHVNGSLFGFEPMAGFGPLEEGSTLRVEFLAGYCSVARTDVMPNWYVAAPNMKAVILQSTAGESLDFVEPFDTKDKWKRFGDKDLYNPYTPEERYDMYVVAEEGPRKLVIPTPKSIADLDGSKTVEISKDWVIVPDKHLENEAKYLTERTGLKAVKKGEEPPASRYIRLALDKVDTSSHEAYILRVDARNTTVTVHSDTRTGVFYGIQTLLQLRSHDNKVPHVTVTDEPRYAFRGLHLDLSRNFLSKDYVMKTLETMGRYKLNKLHLHLTDDEGWRIEIQGLEELTAIGAVRCHTENNRCLQPQLGSGPEASTSGSGFYTGEEYRQILQYAQDRHIQVIPEIDVPGHCHAAVVAMEERYKKYKDSNLPKAEEYRLLDPDDTSQYLSTQYYTDNAINPCLDSTYKFIEKVVKELIDLHRDIQPLKTFHYGGDEVAGAWENSTACQKWLEGERIPEGMKAHDFLMQHFVTKVSTLTSRLKLHLGAWEDGAMTEKNVPYSRDLLTNPEVVANAWSNIWERGGASRAYSLANAGYKVVMSQATHLYFDHPYEPDPEERGYYWAPRFIDTKKVFGFMPEKLYANADVKQTGEPISESEICQGNCPALKQPENVIGVQGNLWTESVRRTDQADLMIWPRMIAVAERAWHKASWEDLKDKEPRDKEKTKDWEEFIRAVGQRETLRLEEQNVAYRIPPPGAKVKGGKLYMTTCLPGLPLQYSTDGASSWQDYSEGVAVASEAKLSLRAASHDKKRFGRIITLTVK